MAKFIQNEESKRFIEVVEELIRSKVVPNVATLCRQLDYDPKSFSHIKTGKRNVPIEIIGKLYTIFGGNPIYVVAGEGNLLFATDSSHLTVHEPVGKYDSTVSETVKRVIDDNQRLEKLLDTMTAQAKVNIKHIAILDEQIAQLKEELSRRSKNKV